MKTNITLFGSEELTSQPFTKSAIEVFANTLIAGVKEGNVGAMATYAKAKFWAAVLEKVTADETIKDGAINEINQYHKSQKCTYNGAELSIMNGGVKYDYSGIPLWAELKAQLDAIQEIAQIAYIKNTPQAYLDNTTGETIIIKPSQVVRKGGSETPKISFK